MRQLRIVGLVVLVAVMIFGGIGAFHWTVNRVYVPEGKSLELTYKGPLIFGAKKYAKAGHFAEEDEIGVRSRLRGPGRHFYCPIWWERKMIDDFVVETRQVAVVTSKLGGPLPEGEFLVDGDLGSTKHKGILRKVYGPGRYRANSFAYEFKIVQTQVEQAGEQEKHSGWVEIPTGYVGVVTYLTDNKSKNIVSGIQQDVLPPGLYPVNPRERQIDIVEIGYRESSIQVTQREVRTGQPVLDESGEPEAVPGTGIDFPSNDGFDIQIDFTAIWGVLPKNAPGIVERFGNIDAVEQKVIIPQSESICRNNGSKLGAVDLLIGDSRQQFQDDTSKEFEEVLKQKQLTLLYGLVRHIYIPQAVRLPIQESFVADELKLTRDQEKLTAIAEGALREAEKKVELESEKVRVETEKLVASVKAEGDKEAKELEAEAKQLVATIDLQAAELDAQKTVVLGEAKAKAEQMQKEASAEKLKLAVDAFGEGAAYTQWQFAEGLPETIDLKLFYAGEGTLWTDLKGITPTLPLRTPRTAPTPSKTVPPPSKG